jgi:hypothetical protein
MAEGDGQQQRNDVPEEVFAASSPTNAKTVDAQKYRVDLDNLLSFLFPLQFGD